jgi:excisionase family DNA binding protein
MRTLKGHAVENNQLQPLAYSPDRAAIRIGKSTRSIYELIATGEIRSYKDGKRRLIPETELQSYVQRKMAQAATA